MDDIWNVISVGFTNIGDWLQDVISSISAFFPNVIANIIAGYTAIVNGLSDVWDTITGGFDAVTNYLNLTLDKVKLGFAELAALLGAVIAALVDLTLLFNPTAPEFIFKVPFDWVREKVDPVELDYTNTFEDGVQDKTKKVVLTESFEAWNDIATSRGASPKIKVNLFAMLNAGTNNRLVGQNPFPNEEVIVFDFADLDDYRLFNMGLVTLVRTLIEVGMILTTLNYVWRKIIPDKVFE